MKNYVASAAKDHKEQTADICLSDAERTPCEIWTRVMGYFRPASEFNQGKKAEFRERKYFSEDKTNTFIQQ